MRFWGSEVLVRHYQIATDLYLQAKDEDNARRCDNEGIFVAALPAKSNVESYSARSALGILEESSCASALFRLLIPPGPPEAAFINTA